MILLDVLDKMNMQDYTLLITFVIIGLVILFIQFRRKSYGINRYGNRKKTEYPLLFNATLIALFIVWLACFCWYISMLEDLYN